MDGYCISIVKMIDPILQSIVTVVGTVLTAVLLSLVNKGLDLLKLKLNVDVTESQRDIIYKAIDTGTGLLQNSINNGLLKSEDLHPDNPKMRAIAARALSNVQESAQSLGVTPELAAQMIVARHATTMSTP